MRISSVCSLQHRRQNSVNGDKTFLIMPCPKNWLWTDHFPHISFFSIFCTHTCETQSMRFFTMKGLHLGLLCAKTHLYRPSNYATLDIRMFRNTTDKSGLSEIFTVTILENMNSKQMQLYYLSRKVQRYLLNHVELYTLNLTQKCYWEVAEC